MRSARPSPPRWVRSNCTPPTSTRQPWSAPAATPPTPHGHVHTGDLFEALPTGLRGRVDILAANVPYVPTEEVALLPAEARDHEPLVALDGGTDGLDLLRRVASEAREWLSPDGCLLVETSARQAPAAADAFTRGGLTPRLAVSEELYAHVVIGTRA